MNLNQFISPEISLLNQSIDMSDSEGEDGGMDHESTALKLKMGLIKTVIEEVRQVNTLDEALQKHDAMTILTKDLGGTILMSNVFHMTRGITPIEVNDIAGKILSGSSEFYLSTPQGVSFDLLSPTRMVAGMSISKPAVSPTFELHAPIDPIDSTIEDVDELPIDTGSSETEISTNIGTASSSSSTSISTRSQSAKRGATMISTGNTAPIRGKVVSKKPKKEISKDDPSTKGLKGLGIKESTTKKSIKDRLGDKVLEDSNDAQKPKTVQTQSGVSYEEFMELTNAVKEMRDALKEQNAKFIEITNGLETGDYIIIKKEALASYQTTLYSNINDIVQKVSAEIIKSYSQTSSISTSKIQPKTVQPQPLNTGGATSGISSLSAPLAKPSPSNACMTIGPSPTVEQLEFRYNLKVCLTGLLRSCTTAKQYMNSTFFWDRSPIDDMDELSDEELEKLIIGLKERRAWRMSIIKYIQGKMDMTKYPDIVGFLEKGFIP